MIHGKKNMNSASRMKATSLTVFRMFKAGFLAFFIMIRGAFLTCFIMVRAAFMAFFRMMKAFLMTIFSLEDPPWFIVTVSGLDLVERKVDNIRGAEVRKGGGLGLQGAGDNKMPIFAGDLLSTDAQCTTATSYKGSGIQIADKTRN